MGGHGGIDDRQPETAATAMARARRVGAEEALGNPLGDVESMPGPRSSTSSTTDPFVGSRRGSRSARDFGVDERVADDVGDHLAQAVLVAGHDRTCRPATSSVMSRERRGGAAASAAASVARARESTGRASSGRCWSSLASSEHVVDQTTHPARLLFSAPHRVVELVLLGQPTVPVQLGVAADRGDRRAQLVRGVGDELPQPRVRLRAFVERALDPPEHLVQGDRRARPARCPGPTPAHACERSPPAISVAVSVMSLIGLIPSRSIHHVDEPEHGRGSPRAPSTSTAIRRRIVPSSSSMRTAVTSTWSPERWASTRYVSLLSDRVDGEERPSWTPVGRWRREPGGPISPSPT